MAKSKYKPEFCELAIKHLQGGNSMASLAAEVGCHRGTIHDWAKVHPEFADALKVGMEFSQKYWEDMGKKMAPDNPAVWIFNMKARFGWKESSEVTIKGDMNHNINLSNMDNEELKNALEKELP